MKSLPGAGNDTKNLFEEGFAGEFYIPSHVFRHYRLCRLTLLSHY